jgi:hypothetical protein
MRVNKRQSREKRGNQVNRIKKAKTGIKKQGIISLLF